MLHVVEEMVADGAEVPVQPFVDEEGNIYCKREILFEHMSAIDFKELTVGWLPPVKPFCKIWFQDDAGIKYWQYIHKLVRPDNTICSDDDLIGVWKVTVYKLCRLHVILCGASPNLFCVDFSCGFVCPRSPGFGAPGAWAPKSGLGFIYMAPSQHVNV
jgi:hypothetical protein